MDTFDPAVARRFPCLQKLEAADLERLARRLEPIELTTGQILFHQGEPGDGAYLLVAGPVELRVATPDQHEHVLATLHEGSLFGEISALLGGTRTATAVATGNVQLWRIPPAALHQAVEAGEAWVSRFLLSTVQELAQRLIAMNQEVGALIADLRHAASKPPAARVAELEQLRARLNTEWSF